MLPWNLLVEQFEGPLAAGLQLQRQWLNSQLHCQRIGLPAWQTDLLCCAVLCQVVLYLMLQLYLML